MKAILFNLYGPIAVQGYGFCIALGVFLALVFLLRDKKLKQFLSEKTFLTGFQIVFFSAIFGGRLLYFSTNSHQFDSLLSFFEPWKGGLSILGAITLSIITFSLYLKIKKVPLLPVLDRITLYTPLMQGFGRLGCFMSGCCYGKPTNLPWAITYHDLYSKAPLSIAIHPTQIYSALLLFGTFLFFYYFLQHKSQKAGTIFFSYLCFASIIRFSIDFLRWDREFSPYLKSFSISQIIGILIFICGMTGSLTIYFSKKTHGSI